MKSYAQMQQKKKKKQFLQSTLFATTRGVFNWQCCVVHVSPKIAVFLRKERLEKMSVFFSCAVITLLPRCC